MGGISFVNFHSKVSAFDFCYTAILCGLVGVFFFCLWEEGIKDNFTWTPHKRLSIQETDISTGRALTLKFLSKPTKIVHAATHSLLLRYDDEELEELVTWMTWLRNPSLDPATRRCLLKRKWRKANWEAEKGLNDDIFIEEEEEEIFLFITCSNCGMSYRHISGRWLINYSIHRQKGRTGGAAITQRHYLWCLDSSRRFLSLSVARLSSANQHSSQWTSPNCAHCEGSLAEHVAVVYPAKIGSPDEEEEEGDIK